MSSEIDISRLNKADVLCALYNACGRQVRTMSRDEAEKILAMRSAVTRIDGKAINIDLSGPTIYVKPYDREHGEGAALKALQAAGLL
jgi:hypothetical protein